MNKRIYNNVARQLNKALPYGQVTVLDTKNHGNYCDIYSLYLDDNAYDMLYQQGDSMTKTIFNQTFEIGKEKYYIEPYNSRLLNLAVL